MILIWQILTQKLFCAYYLTHTHIQYIFIESDIVNDPRAIYFLCRTRNLTRLVLPGRQLHITEEGVREAVQMWRALESLTLTDNETACAFIEAIGRNCMSFRELKITCNFSCKIAQALTMYIPKLKRLSLQSTRVNMDALFRAVSLLPELEDLNISHCFVVGGSHPQDIRVYPLQQVPGILLNAGVLRMPTRLIDCQAICSNCELVLAWNMGFERKNPEEQIWKEDEIPTLRI